MGQMTSKAGNVAHLVRIAQQALRSTGAEFGSAVCACSQWEALPGPYSLHCYWKRFGVVLAYW
jgi:hypothetical protein